jgi:thiol-disulfide isomerase/thioredoxin
MFKKLTYIFTLFVALSVNSQNNFELNTEIPDFKLWLLDDSELTKENIKNKVVVFKFWFTSCTPCIADIPKLNALVKEFEKRSDILFIAPALDRKPVVEKLLKRFPFQFRIAYNSMDVSAIFNKKQVYPSYFVINKKGKFTFIDSGSKQSSFNDLRNAIIKALKE